MKESPASRRGFNNRWGSPKEWWKSLTILLPEMKYLWVWDCPRATVRRNTEWNPNCPQAFSFTLSLWCSVFSSSIKQRARGIGRCGSQSFIPLPMAYGSHIRKTRSRSEDATLGLPHYTPNDSTPCFLGGIDQTNGNNKLDTTLKGSTLYYWSRVIKGYWNLNAVLRQPLRLSKGMVEILDYSVIGIENLRALVYRRSRIPFNALSS